MAVRKPKCLLEARNDPDGGFSLGCTICRNFTTEARAFKQSAPASGHRIPARQRYTLSGIPIEPCVLRPGHRTTYQKASPFPTDLSTTIYTAGPTIPSLSSTDESSSPSWKPVIISEIGIPAQSDRQTRSFPAKQHKYRDWCREWHKGCKHKRIACNERKLCAKHRSLHRLYEYRHRTNQAGPILSNGISKPSLHTPPRAPAQFERGKRGEISREKVVTISLRRIIALAETTKLADILQNLCKRNPCIADRVIRDLRRTTEQESGRPPTD